MGLTSVGACRFLSLPVLSEAPKGTVGAGVGRGGVAAGPRVPQLEAPRDRTLEAEGCEAGEILSPVFVVGPAPWDSTREGTPAGQGLAGGVGLTAACLTEGFLVRCMLECSRCRPCAAGLPFRRVAPEESLPGVFRAQGQVVS